MNKYLALPTWLIVRVMLPLVPKNIFGRVEDLLLRIGMREELFILKFLIYGYGLAVL